MESPARGREQEGERPQTQPSPPASGEGWGRGVVLRPGWAPVRESEGGRLWVSVCVPVCTCDGLDDPEVCVCVHACFSLLAAQCLRW